MPDHEGSPEHYVRLATQDDVDYLTPRLRQADLDEIAANTGSPPGQALHRGFEDSTQCYVGVTDNLPFIIFGAVPITEGVGAVWALGSDDLLKARTAFLRQSRMWVNVLHGEYPLLFNYVDARNAVHIRWLKWLGFTFVNKHPEFGVARLPFFEFVRIKPHV